MGRPLGVPVSTAEDVYRSRYGLRDAMLAELSTGLGIPPIRGVTVKVPRGAAAS